MRTRSANRADAVHVGAGQGQLGRRDTWLAPWCLTAVAAVGCFDDGIEPRAVDRDKHRVPGIGAKYGAEIIAGGFDDGGAFRALELDKADLGRGGRIRAGRLLAAFGGIGQRRAQNGKPVERQRRLLHQFGGKRRWLGGGSTGVWHLDRSGWAPPSDSDKRDSLTWEWCKKQARGYSNRPTRRRLPRLRGRVPTGHGRRDRELRSAIARRAAMISF